MVSQSTAQQRGFSNGLHAVVCCFTMLGVLCGLHQFSLGTHKTRKLPRSTVTVFSYVATTRPLCEAQATVATDTVFITLPTLGFGSWNQMNANCERTLQLGRGVRHVTFTLHSLP